MPFDTTSAYALVSGLQDAVIVIDRRGVIVFANEAAATLSDAAPIRQGASIAVLLPDWPVSMIDQSEGACLPRAFRTTAGTVPFDIHISRWGEDELFIGLVILRGETQAPAHRSDGETETARREAQVFHLAHLDALTGLANRVAFHKALDRALDTRESGRDVVIHCLDLDGFTSVNDAFGQGGGDELLRLVAARLRASVRHGDLVARLGGDEFAILQTAATSDRDVLAARLIAVFKAPFAIEGKPVMIGVSVGYAVAPRDGTTTDTLMVAADTALHAAKRAGKNTWRGHSRRLLLQSA